MPETVDLKYSGVATKGAWIAEGAPDVKWAQPLGSADSRSGTVEDIYDLRPVLVLRLR